MIAAIERGDANNGVVGVFAAGGPPERLDGVPLWMLLLNLAATLGKITDVAGDDSRRLASAERGGGPAAGTGHHCWGQGTTQRNNI